MLGSVPFPICVADLTGEFLSSALRAEVTDFTSSRIGADRGMLGELFLIEPAYAAGSIGPAQFVAKFAALREGALESARRGGTHERELRCYVELLPDTPISTPALLGAWYDPDTAHFLLLQEAIAVDGTVDQIRGITQGQARSVLAQMARFHAHWWRSDRLATATWLPRLNGDTRVQNLTTLARTGWSALTELLGSSLAAEDVRFGDRLADTLPDALQTLAGLPSTLLHCDLRADNLLFAPGADTVTIVDWQGAGIGPPSFDLAYFLVQSLTIEDRRSHQEELLDFYRHELHAAGLPLTPDQVRAGWGDALNYGLTIACAIPLISDPAEPRVATLARTVATRSLAALRDHASTGAPHDATS